MAQRVHAAGMLVHLDVMHSDWRAGPGPQRVLCVWSGCPDCACTEGKNCRCAAGKGCRTELDVDKLAQHAYEFTASVISQVTTACSGYPPHIVQACNEITNGMLWAPPVANCSHGGATCRPGNVSACQTRCAHTNATNYTKAALLRCRYMCGTSGPVQLAAA